MLRDKCSVKGARTRQTPQEAEKQRHVSAGRDGQMQVRDLARRRATRIDIDDERAAAPLFARRRQALKQHRVAPGEVGADQHDEIGLLEIFVDARHDVGAEGAAMAGDGGRHAEPRIRVDISGADESLHQLVGDVIILREDLARHVEGDGIWTMTLDRPRKATRDEIERLRPCRPLAADFRIEEPVLEPERGAKRRALDAQPAEIGGMRGIACNLGAT